MPRQSQIDDDKLLEARLEVKKSGVRVTAQVISDLIYKKFAVKLDESTIRGRFIELGQPLRGTQKTLDKNSADTVILKPVQAPPKPVTGRKSPLIPTFQVPANLKGLIPTDAEMSSYVERPVDKRLALHLDLKKHPLAQGKQGTGKTFSYAYYAYVRQLPFFLYSMHADFKLNKHFGDKTIRNGSIEYQESQFVDGIQNPSVILFDEVNATENENTWDFHALLQNGELYIKDADGGKGRIYKVHPECRIGFAQNPKSAKYIGGNIKPSNFLGRCTYITYPDFTITQINKVLEKRFPTLVEDDRVKFIAFFTEVNKLIDTNKIPVDISIRQLINTIDLWIHGMDLTHAIDDGLASIVDAASLPKDKQAIMALASQSFGKDVVSL